VALPSCRLASPIIAISGVNLVSARSVYTKCSFAKFYNVKNNTHVMLEGASYIHGMCYCHLVHSNSSPRLVCRNVKGNIYKIVCIF
jgi:hypothetical protein